MFHLEKDDDRKPILKKETKAVAQSKDKAVKFDPDVLNESHSAKKVSLVDETDIDMEPVDENESGRIVNLKLFHIANPYTVRRYWRISSSPK